VENVFPPLPGDTITAFGAFLVGIGRLNFFGVFLSVTFGSLLGFMSLYWLGMYLGRKFFIQNNYSFFRSANIVKAETWFKKYGYIIIVINRFIPGVRSAISIAGGISRLNMFKVALLALVSCAIWNLLWISMGYILGNNWGLVKLKLSALLLKYNLSVLGLFILFVFILLIRRFWKRKRA
jgi:membrane protein DedA with SNARE-associated domain